MVIVHTREKADQLSWNKVVHTYRTSGREREKCNVMAVFSLSPFLLTLLLGLLYPSRSSSRSLSFSVPRNVPLVDSE